jgi:nitrite reductase (NADH) large subunit
VFTKLKVMGIDLAAMGDKEPLGEDDEVVSYSEPSRGTYKKLIIRNERLAGAIVIGDGAVVPSLLQWFADGALVPGNRADLLFSSATPPPPAAIATAETSRVCDCNNVTKAQLIEAVLKGARSVQAVCDVTRASTGCGSCRPEVEAIVELACRGLEPVDAAPDAYEAAVSMPLPLPEPPAAGADVAVTLNKIERYKREKDGLDVIEDVPRFARDGWESIGDADRERLKWLGVFFRRQTPGRFMMRIRMPNGFTNAAQLRTIAELSEECGTGFVDITTRQ